MDAVRKDPDAVIADATMDVDVTMAAGFPLETAPADATFSGSSFSFAHAAATASAVITAVVMETGTAAGSLSSFCCSAVDGETAADADVAPHRKKPAITGFFLQFRDSGIFPCPVLSFTRYSLFRYSPVFAHLL